MRETTNSLAPRSANTSLKRADEKFSSFIQGEKAVAMIEKAIATPPARARFTATLLGVVAQNEKLQECKPATILSSALYGEGLNLSLALQQFYVVPYKNKDGSHNAQFQIAAKGLKQLAIRSRAYKKIEVFPVHEGELVGRDKMTREPIFNWIEDDEERERKPIVGYYAFYELSNDYNNFFSYKYMSHKSILRHANEYSKAFDIEKYEKLLSGEIKGWDAQKLQNGSPWYGAPDSAGHIKMCEKTVMRQLLTDGFAPLSIEMREVITQDEEYSNGKEYIPSSRVDLARKLDENEAQVVDTVSEPPYVPLEELNLKEDKLIDNSDKVAISPRKAPKKASKEDDASEEESEDLPDFLMDQSDLPEEVIDVQIDGQEELPL